MVKIKAKSPEECITVFDIEVSQQTIEKAFGEVYGELTRIANIPGFRVGKAPRAMVEQHYAKDAKEEVLKRLIPIAYGKALEEHKITPVGLPSISDVNFDTVSRLVFKASVATRPQFKLKNYKGIAIERKKAAVSDADVDSTLNNLRQMHAKYEAVEDRPVRMGDYVVADLEAFHDGKPLHKKRENTWLFIDKESVIPGLSEQVVGMKKGEERDIDVTLPDAYPDKNVAGKKVRYHVLAKEIKMRHMPELSDEFAKDLGVETLDAMRKEVRSELEARAKANAEAEVENKLLAKLMDDNVFPVPSTFVERQLKLTVENAKRRLLEKGFKKEDLDKKDAEFREKFKEDALRQVRLLFILDDIASVEKIDITEDDIEEAFQNIAARANKDIGEVKKYYEDEDLVDNLSEKLREEKTIEFLLKNAVITDKE